MKEHITKFFYPENDEEEKNIHNMRELIYGMNDCLRANIMGDGDYHFIKAIFERKIRLY